MVGKLHPFSKPKENPSDLSHRLLAEIDGALRELDAITAPNDDVADRIGCAENAIRRAREAAAALSGREAVACERCGGSGDEFNWNGDGPYPCRYCTPTTATPSPRTP